uniref:DH domain-containing protein n=1 Tax=Heterorhabditis bacteriophora TaxID=37862 RepID=A0A1I7XQH7_HETBA
MFVDSSNGYIIDVAAEIILPVRDLILPESPLASLFLIYSNMYNFRMWRKPVDVRVNDLKALCASTLDDILMTCPSSSADSIIPIGLPNGKTTVVTHNSTVPEELLSKVCAKLAVQCLLILIYLYKFIIYQVDLFEMIHTQKEGWKLALKEEYEVEKKQGKLGLTIYAYKDNGLIKAEVRGIAPYAPGGSAMGDAVISVDGMLISQQHLKEKTRLRDMIPPPCEESRIKLEEKLLRGIDELVQTEKKYVDDLKEFANIIQYFLGILLITDKFHIVNKIIDRFLCIRSVLDIMESAQRLEKMQVTFLDALEEAVGDIATGDLNKRPQIRVGIKDSVIRVCALFVNRCSEFKIYAEYAAAYFRLQQEIPIRKDIMASLEAANSSKEQHCSYESKMIKPIQRLVQYPLLLRAIQAGCEKGSLEARQVEAALYKMQTLAEYVNEMQRIHEQYAPHIDNVRRANVSMFKEKGLRIDIRDLVIFAHIRWLNGEKAVQDYVVFVFHTVILLLPGNIRRDCKSKWIRILPINEVEVEDSKKNEAVLVIIHVAFKEPNGHLSQGNPDAVYEIACCQSKLKQQLIKSIKRARANFSENRRPLSGSSLSDGGYGSDPAKERKSS